MALDKFEEITLSCGSFLVRFFFFVSLRFMAKKNWLPTQIKEELLLTPSPSVIFKFISLDIHQHCAKFLIYIQFTARAHKVILSCQTSW